MVFYHTKYTYIGLVVKHGPTHTDGKHALLFATEEKGARGNEEEARRDADADAPLRDFASEARTNTDDGRDAKIRY